MIQKTLGRETTRWMKLAGSEVFDKERERIKVNVGIQTAALLVTLWISYGHPVHNKHAGYLFEFHLSITIAVI